MNTRQQTASNPDTRPVSLGFIFGLCLFALIAILSRLWLMGPTELAGGDRLWQLSIDASLKAEAQTTSVQIHPPLETSKLKIIQRSLHHPGFRIRNWKEDALERRSILAFANRHGIQSLKVEFFIHQLASQSQPQKSKRSLLTNSQREQLLQDSEILQMSNPIVQQTLRSLAPAPAERPQVIENIFSYLQLFTASYQKDELNVPTTLSNRRATTLDRALAMVALCRAAGFPSRVISGLILKEEIETEPHYWVEVYLDEQWLAYDIAAGYREAVPENYLSLRRDGFDIVQVLNGELMKVNYDLEREYDHPYLSQFKSKNFLSIFNLQRLPLDTRNELAILMLLPLGVLITALCRHLAGLRSYGVFTPTLLALAMVYTDILSTLLVFFIVSGLAVAGRSLFPASITRIPRLAIIFTLVALLLSFTSSLMDYYDLRQGQGIILLPIIILTSLVDRLYRTIEDKGITIAMHRLAWTVIITLLCLPVVQFETLGQLLLSYPEIHFVSLALFLLLADYKGKQLIHLPLIKFLAEPEREKKPKTKPTEGEQHAP
ncbi:MAG: hypothetical protein OEY52_04185 [Gammaproteobacteria bacterium]|nr:hypothetical protein [Gammaproteobacteria bacterium]